MKISRKEISKMVQERYDIIKQKNEIANKISEIKKEISIINEDTTAIEPKPKTGSIFDVRAGEMLILNFQDITIKIQRQLDDIFKVIDADESQKLKNGDYIRILGNDTLSQGKKFKFEILRSIGVKYETNPLEDWKMVK